MSNPACSRCGHGEHVIKSGLNHTKSQRYRCQAYRRCFTVDRKPHGYDLALRKQALQLYLEGTSFRAIGRLLGVHHQSVSNWITEAANALPTHITDQTPTETIELDETLRLCPAEKNRVYVVMAGARESGLIVGQAVSPDCGLDTLQALADTLPPAQRYASDGHAAYSEVLWPEGGQHLLSLGKEETSMIESLNANLRTYLKRLARRSRCFSRSLEALRQAIRLFVYYYNHRQRRSLAHPALKGRLPLLN